MNEHTVLDWARIGYAAHREFNFVALGKELDAWEKMDQLEREFFVKMAERVIFGKTGEIGITQKVFVATIKALASSEHMG